MYFEIQPVQEMSLERMTSTPAISIIMPCYQQVQFLEEAVRSVLDQQETSTELIVMDPGSTDGSRELLNQLKDEYGGYLVLNFNPDSGQADAVNRGMSIARANVLGWLNSDDRLRPGALAAAVTHLKSKTQPCWMYGRGGIINEQGAQISSLIVAYKNWRGKRFSICKLITEDFIPQMSTFWNRAMWETAGGLDISRHLDMDYDLFLRFAFIASPVVCTEYFADFRVHQHTKSSQRTAEHLAAAARTAQQYSAPLGVRGSLAYILHLIFSARTRLIYRIIKP
jgi:glycosyltransferase involved in cell wall biosynthesis